jgi:hypothetical protein
MSVQSVLPARPDGTTAAVCRWLSRGGSPGDYGGPDPGTGHDLSPLLSRETGRRELYLTATASWFRKEQMIRPALDRIAGSGAEVWAVKGLDLAESLYPFPGGRPMCDVDFLVDSRNLDEVLGSFIRSGWTMRSPGMGAFRAGIVSELKLSLAGVRAEIHTHPFYFPRTMPGRLPADLFTGGRNLSPGLAGLSWHNALLYCILHMLTNASLRPVWWVDVFLLSRKVTGAGSWMEFTANAAGTGLGRPIAGLLTEAEESLGIHLPPAVAMMLRRDARGRERILEGLRGERGKPTLTCLRHLHGWRRLAWLVSLLWLAVTGGDAVRPYPHA